MDFDSIPLTNLFIRRMIARNIITNKTWRISRINIGTLIMIRRRTRRRIIRWIIIRIMG